MHSVRVFLIGARDPVKESQERTSHLVESGEITSDEIPKILDRICKIKGNAGDIGKEIRKKLKKF